jgi:hypothetical protein
MKTDDPGLRLTPTGQRLLWAAIIIGLLIAIGWALTDTADAAPNHFPTAGNKDGCAAGNRWRGLACTVADAGPGWVSGDCDFGLWFGRTPTARTFKMGQAITVQGCEAMAGELFSAKGWPLRISR